MKVHEIMTARARCISPDNSLVEAAGLMRELDVGALPVCDEDRLAGMVTDRDLVVRGMAEGRDPYTATVRDVMSEGVLYIKSDQDVEEAARMMQEKQVRRLPVINREKRLVGILSLGDLAVNSNPAFSGQALKEVSESPRNRMSGGKVPHVRSEMSAAERRAGEAAAARRTPPGTRRADGTDSSDGAPADHGKRRSTSRSGGKVRGASGGKVRAAASGGKARAASSSGAQQGKRKVKSARRSPARKQR
jgi:CBS domain-containing protein